MGHRVDFSRNAQIYDRLHSDVLSDDAAQRLTIAAGLQSNAWTLDIGAGTGRVAVALARSGRHVIGLEPVSSMLEILRRKTAGLPVSGVAGEGAHLPFRTASFDAVVLARVLYLMPDWRNVLYEAGRVLNSTGRILFEWGNGSPDEEWVQVREKARMLFEQAGVKNPFHPGVRSETEVDDFLFGQGWVQVDNVQMNPTVSMTLAEFLRRVIDGEYSYTWEVPLEIQRPCLAELKSWATARFGLDRSVPVPREIKWKIFQRYAV